MTIKELTTIDIKFGTRERSMLLRHEGVFYGDMSTIKELLIES